MNKILRLGGKERRVVFFFFDTFGMGGNVGCAVSSGEILYQRIDF